MTRAIRFGIALGFSGLVLSALLRHFDLAQTIALVRQADLRLLTAGLSLMVLAYLLRGARWRIWERGLSYWDSLRLIVIGFMGNNVLPARLGELLRAHCTSARMAGDRGRTAALASIAAERILDGMILGLLGALDLWFVAVDRRMAIGLLAVSFGFALLTMALVVGIGRHDRIRAVAAAARRRFPGHMTAFAHEKVTQFMDGVLPLDTGARLTAAIAATAAIWAIEAAACFAIGRAVSDAMTVGHAVLFLVVVNFASLVPFTLGGIGSIEAAAPAFLISSGIGAAPALAMVLLQHGAQYFFTTMSGGVCYLGGGFHRIPLADPKAAGRRSAAPRAPVAAAAPPSRVIEDARSSLGALGTCLRPVPRGDIDLSIVIPAYNEQARLPRTVLETLRWCTARNLAFEVVIADDGSRDETLALGRLFEDSDMRVRTLACPHAGKGAAVRMGVLNARGQVVLFMDADGATPLDELPKLRAAIDEGYDVAIGSRVVQRPGEVEVQTSWHRRVIGRTFALFVNLCAIEGIGDTQCGFKMFRREAAAAIFSRQKGSGFAFDVEVLFIARRLHRSIAEIPVNWVAQPGSKVNLVTDSMRMLWDITWIRWQHRHLHGDPDRDGAGERRFTLAKAGPYERSA